MNLQEILDQPADLMRRRTSLLFSRRFMWLGSSVEMHTDSPAIFDAAENAGFLPECDVERRPEMRWEIVSEPPVVAAADDWAGKVTVDNNSLFLSMGIGQWFAFDFETGDGAGFVVVSGPRASCETNAEQYLLEIAHHVGNCLRAKLERSCPS